MQIDACLQKLDEFHKDRKANATHIQQAETQLRRLRALPKVQLPIPYDTMFNIFRDVGKWHAHMMSGKVNGREERKQEKQQKKRKRKAITHADVSTDAHAEPEPEADEMPSAESSPKKQRTHA